MAATTAEEALQSLARDLVEEIAAARALELTGEDPAEALELAIFNIRPFQRTQRVGRSGKVVHESVRGYEEARQDLLGEHPGGSLFHPGDLGGEHLIHGEPSHMGHNVSEPDWVAHEWKGHRAARAAWRESQPRPARQPKSAQKIAEDVEDTRQRLGTAHPAAGHLSRAREHLGNRDQDARHAARAYEELARTHQHIREQVLPLAGPGDYQDIARHLQLVSGHMQDLDRAMGADPDYTRRLLGTYQENFAHAGEARRMVELAGAGQQAAETPQGPPPPQGARAVLPHLGGRHVTALAGDTMSGTAHRHVPRPFEVPQPTSDQARAQKAEGSAQRAAEELEHQRSMQSLLRDEKQNAAVLQRMGLPAPGEYRPFSDDEFTLHQQQVDKSVEQAFRDGLDTRDQHTANGDGSTWEPDRASLHAEILRDYLDKQADVPSQRHALVLGGLPGAGKSTLFRQKGISPKDYAVVSADTFKEELARRGMVPEVAGLSPMEASTLAHEESRHLTNLALAELERRGKNIAVEVTLSKLPPSARLVSDLKDHGYTVTGILADIPAELSADRAGRRYRSELEAYRRGSNPLGGRYIPRHDLLIAEAQPGETWPQRTFGRLKDQFSYWERWDGSQTPPVLAEKASQTPPAPGAGIPSVEQLRRGSPPYTGSTEAEARAAEKGTASP